MCRRIAAGFGRKVQCGKGCEVMVWQKELAFSVPNVETVSDSFRFLSEIPLT